MDKLLPCPFCGSGGELIRHYGQESNRPYWIVTCCKTSAVTKREAIIAWNRRPAPSESEAIKALYGALKDIHAMVQCAHSPRWKAVGDIAKKALASPPQPAQENSDG